MPVISSTSIHLPALVRQHLTLLVMVALPAILASPIIAPWELLVGVAALTAALVLPRYRGVFLAIGLGLLVGAAFYIGLWLIHRFVQTVS